MKPLSTKQLRKAKSFPEYTGECPTCGGKKTYTLDGQVYDCDCEKQLKLQRRYFAANIGALYHNISLGDFFEGYSGLAQVITDYIEFFENNLYYGRGVTFHGPLGTGKSFAATIILKSLIQKGYDAYFITFDDLLNLQSKGWKESEYNHEFYTVRDTQILVIDEIFAALEGTKKKELLAETLERIIRYRVSNRMPTILTTNMSPEEEANAYPRVNSLLATSQIRCHVSGDDLRKSQVRTLTDQRIKRGDRKPIV